MCTALPSLDVWNSVSKVLGSSPAAASLVRCSQTDSPRHPCFYRPPAVLLLYEGGAAAPEEARVRVRLVDFAHTFSQSGGGDTCTSGASAPACDGSGDACGGSGNRGNGGGGGSDACVGVSGVDFSDVKLSSGGSTSGSARLPPRDANFLAGLRALLARLRSVVHAQLQAELT